MNDTKKKAVELTLQMLNTATGGEDGHMEVDAALLSLIETLLDGDDRITLAFGRIPNMWYA